MKYLTFSIIVALGVLCSVGGNRGQSAVGEEVQDEEAIPTTTTTTTQQPASASNSALPKPIKRVKSAKDRSGFGGSFCPKSCICDEKLKKIACVGDLSKNAPPTPFDPSIDWSGLVSIEMRKFALPNMDLTQLVNSKDTLESLVLTDCQIKTFSPPAVVNKRDKEASFSKLKTLLLDDNELQSIGKLANWKLPLLETLSLGSNPLTELGQSDFNNTKSLQNLNLQNLEKLKMIHEQAFQPLSQLRTLNMTGTKLETHLGDKQFVANQKLETLDLTDNGLIEVPFALRATNSISRLILNSNYMTSLRQSDFINRTKLTELEIRGCPRLSKIDDLTFSELTSLTRLIISDNLALTSISKDAFKSPLANHTLDIIDIRNNNLTTLANPLEFASLSFKQLLLSGNPWHCDCHLNWFYDFTAQSRPLAHCKTPAQYKDIEVTEFLATIDCETVDSILRTVIVIGFFLFLFILLALVFVQKSDFCRRFLWRDQYGTIYYTKASFPTETV